MPSMISMISSISVSKVFLWNVENQLDIVKCFNWEVGSGPLYWFRIETECETPPTKVHRASFTAPGCQMSFTSGNVTTSDCPKPNCPQQQILHLMGTNIQHICEQLTQMRFVGYIKHVHRWSKPALECDILADERRGIDHFCNMLIPVDFCKCDCMAFIKPGKCPSLHNDNITWFTEYQAIQPSVKKDQTVIGGQQIGKVSGGILHFSLKDQKGNTLDLDDHFALPKTGVRPKDSGKPPQFEIPQDCVCFIKNSLRFPVDPYDCRNCSDLTMGQTYGCWHQYLGDQDHKDKNYFELDLYCPRPGDGQVINDNDMRESVGVPVFCACAGFDVESTVVDVTKTSVTIKHQRVGRQQECSGSGISQMSFMLTTGTDRSLTFSEPVTPVSFVDLSPLSIDTSPVAATDLITPPTGTVMTDCGVSLPLALYVSHNLEALLRPFLRRHGLRLPEVECLSYSEINGMWHATRHLQGHGDGYVISWEFTCTELGWKLGLNVKHKDKNSRLSFLYPHEDTPVLNLRGRTPQVIYDGIGLFRGQTDLKVAVTSRRRG